MLDQKLKGQPFLTIGITTYNRHDLLRDTLNSVLSQGFTDFNIIVGNDYQAEVLTCEMLEMSDPRIRIINYPRNLGEVGNMNALLEMASGRYFTWLFDDDLYEPNFLQTAYDCLTKTGYPPAFFSSFRKVAGNEQFRPQTPHYKTMTEFTGREFLRWFSPSRPQLYPTYGLFDTDILKCRLGGFDKLCNSAIGLYSEYLFLTKCALLEKMVYIDAPLYIYRDHDGSWSESNTDLWNYLEAGPELIRRSSEVLRDPILADHYAENLLKVCSIHLIEFAFKSGQHVKYLPLHAQKEFGLKEISRIFSSYWSESSRTRELYITLQGDGGFRKWFTFLRRRLFCNYSIFWHIYRFCTKRAA